jgi:hypothetical protein
MKVFDGCSCRLGNAIFRYFASSLFCIIYKASRTYNQNECNSEITEYFYRDWCNSILQSNKIIDMNPNITYKFDGFYQTDIYKIFRNDLNIWCREHPNDSVNSSDGSIVIRYCIGDLLSELNDDKKYDVVVHIRLEDYVTSGEKLIIHPDSICDVIEEIGATNFCFVSNKITTEFEKKYMDYFKNKYKDKFNIIFESNDIITDFKIMNNAKIMICSLSTLCWSAGLLSKNIEKVYFPKNRFKGWHNQTFTTIIQNTQLYDNILCNEKELTKFLDI